MKVFLFCLIALMGISGTSRADDGDSPAVSDLALFTVHGSGKTIEYHARVNTSDCQFDPNKPTAVYMVDATEERQITWLESHVLAFDYLEKAATKIVAEVKYLENHNIHWPLTLVVNKDDSGQCVGTAVGSDSGEIIDTVDITDTNADGDPTQIVVNGTLKGQAVQLPMSLN